MAKIKHTKNELKAQQEALRRFQRFLPMLQLKKQQLQAEISQISNQIQTEQEAFDKMAEDLRTWVQLFATPESGEAKLVLQNIATSEGNIAGVSIPVLEDVQLQRPETDAFLTPLWIDDAQERLDAMLRQRVAIRILEEQKTRVQEELRTTSQRVNLFEKVKIPECKENIRTIKIFLGDEQTAAVARGKLAKKRTEKQAAQADAARSAEGVAA